MSAKKYISFSSRAEAAEERGDWQEAKRCWYYAAQACHTNAHGLRTYYGQREDAAEIERLRKLEK